MKFNVWTNIILLGRAGSAPSGGAPLDPPAASDLQARTMSELEREIGPHGHPQAPPKDALQLPTSGLVASPADILRALPDLPARVEAVSDLRHAPAAAVPGSSAPVARALDLNVSSCTHSAQVAAAPAACMMWQQH